MSQKLDIRPRFRRSIRIDSDYKTPVAIDGFVCPTSFKCALQFMAKHVTDTGQAAFTWTGPYGGGKSSLALALACLTGAAKSVREKATEEIGRATVDALKDALPYYPSRWDVLPLVTEKRSITTQLAEALDLDLGSASLANDVLSSLASKSENRGLLVLMDELGRGLEAAAEGDGDVHILQDIAELASRSNGRTVFVGILHQSFEEYAEKLGREARDSWAKIQGRFVDISIAVSLDETIELVASAMGRADGDDAIVDLAMKTVAELRPIRSDADARRLAGFLTRCSPMHPITTCLLGPLSRRRFGQNQRSVFSFLHSSEPFGLQDVIASAPDGVLYRPYTLWDYVRANFESAVLASPDSKRWSVAVDAIERCSARGGSQLELDLLKSIGIIELVKDRSGVSSSPAILNLAQYEQAPSDIEDALRSLERHSEIIYRKHIGSYVLYSGSDFDVDSKVDEALAASQETDLALVRELADLQPLLAKRHHRKTGAMRWFEIGFSEVARISESLNEELGQDTIGRIIQAIPCEGESCQEVVQKIEQVLDDHKSAPLLIGFSDRSRNLVEFGRELSALMDLEEAHPELRGDLVARREIDARIAELRRRIEDEVEFLFENSEWFSNGQCAQKLSKRALNELLSNIADETFPQAPAIQNELLNCTSPSTNAVSARTKLMKRMVLRWEDEALGFGGKKYPAERGLFVSLLEETGLHRDAGDSWAFTPPQDPKHPLWPLWDIADTLLDDSAGRVVTARDIMDAWRAPPIGLKFGLSYVFLVAYALSRRETVAVYGEGIFQSRFNELCVEFLAREPSDVGLRKVEMAGLTSDILQELGSMLRITDAAEPLNVARAIIAQYDELVPWTGRTQSLSPTTLKVREILKRASDPNKLLFDDLPALTEPKKDGTFSAKEIARVLRDALSEMRAAYPNTLSELKSLMLNELDVRAETSAAIAQLRERADNIHQIGGDLRMDAFVSRLSQFHGTTEDMEGISSIAANKLPRDWNDSDRERARVGIAELAQTFLRYEAMARVKGRKDRRQAVALVVGRDNDTLPLFSEFEISDADRRDVSALATAVDEALSNADQERREIILAALIEVTSRYLEQDKNERNRA